MRVSEYFQIGRSQATLDFVDVDITNDIAVHVDPSTIRHLPDDWGKDCLLMLTTFFDSVLDAVRSGDQRRTMSLLGNLGEPNETHLGLSKGRSAGRGFGKAMSIKFAENLSTSKAARTGLIEDLEDTAFFIDKVDIDIISDVTTNIIRGPLITYTQQMADAFDIPLTSGVNSGPVWDPHSCEWEQGYVDLPVADGEKLILVPKVIVRRSMHLSRNEYYRHHLIPVLQAEEVDNPASKLARTLKNGRRQVTKKAIAETYGSKKPDVTRLSLERPSIYAHYRDIKRATTHEPLSHRELSDVGSTPRPDYGQLLESVLTVPPGREHATAYHMNIEALLTALFYPSLAMPEIEEEIHEGRKRIDISYTNIASEGFFRYLTRHKITSRYVFVECKNYGSEAGNPELDQLSSRFSPLRSQIGILACRSFQNKELFLRRCRDTALDQRGYVITLDDDDLKDLTYTVQTAINWAPAPPPTDGIQIPPNVSDYPLLHKRLKALVN